MTTDPAPDLEVYFQQGVEARANGQREGDNPFGHESREWREWRAGWRATCDLDEEDDPASDRLHKQDELPEA